MLSCRSGTATCTWKRFIAFSWSGLRGNAPPTTGGTRFAGGRGLRRGRACRAARHAVARAAVFSEVAEQRVHLLEVGRVIDEAPGLARCDESGVGQLLQVKGERG